MRTMSLILVCGLVTASIGCQRAEKATAEKSTAEQTSADKASTSPESKSTEEIAKEAPPATTNPTPGQQPVPQQAVAETKPGAASEVEPAPQPTPSETKTSADAQTKSAQPAQTDAAGNKIPTKAEILASPQFRQAIFEFNEWLTAQPIYTPQQVAQIKDQFNHRVAEMNAQELSYLLSDLEAKMKLINTPEAREARAWMAQYLSVMSDRKRAEVLKDVPNVATMTAAQLSSELSKIQEKRAVMDNEQAAFEKGQASQVAQQIRTDRINQQNFVRDWNSPPVSYSPYSNGGRNVNERLNNTPIGTGMTFYTGGWGGVGVAFSPSSW